MLQEVLMHVGFPRLTLTHHSCLITIHKYVLHVMHITKIRVHSDGTKALRAPEMTHYLASHAYTL